MWRCTGGGLKPAGAAGPAPAPAPRVSVIVPAFNAQATIAEAVRSALGQTLRDLEVIVIDDGSTDGTAATVAALAAADPRVRLLRHSGNRGAGAARNSGLQAARAPWLAPIDADDVMEPFRLERLCAAADATGADFIADNLRFDDAGVAGATPEYAYDPAFLRRASPLTVEALVCSDLPRNGICSFGYLKPVMRRAFLDAQGLRYDESLFMTEDFHLFVSAVLAGARFCCVDWSGYRYRRTPDSLSRSPARFVRNLRAAAEGSQRLAVRAAAAGRPDAVRLLRQHRIGIELTLWVEGSWRALRQGRWATFWTLMRAMPPHPVALLRWIARRVRAGRRPTPTALGQAPLRSG